MNTVRYTEIPPKDQYALDKYLDAKIPVSGFLYAVLTCNLIAVAEEGTPTELMNLKHYIKYMQDNATKGSWGSATAVRMWLSGDTNTRGAYAKRKGS